MTAAVMPAPGAEESEIPAGARPEVVGVVPAAGRATRLPRLPTSKEVYPIGFRVGGEKIGPVAAAESLLEAMGRAGARSAFVVLRRGKWDVAAYLGGGPEGGPSLAYVVLEGDADTAWRLGTPYTVDRAHPFTVGRTVLFGFPDIVFRPPDALERLRDRLRGSRAEVVLGLFPADRPEKMDMVELEEGGRIRSIVIKPRHTELRYTWILAAWTGAFTDRLHAYVADPARRPSAGSGRRGEHYVGDVIRAALEEGMVVEGLPFENGRYIDIGTPADLERAVREFSRDDGWSE